MLSTEYIKMGFPYHPAIGDVALYRRQVPAEEEATEVDDLIKGNSA